MDDVLHWILAKDCKSIPGLFSVSNYDDHVGLWKLLLFIAVHFISDNPITIQILHLVVINIAVWGQVFIYMVSYSFSLILYNGIVRINIIKYYRLLRESIGR